MKNKYQSPNWVNKILIPNHITSVALFKVSIGCLFIGLNLTFCCSLYAQTAVSNLWSDTFGLQDTVVKTPMVIGPNNEVFVAGTETTQSGGVDILIKRIDSTGQTIWSENFSGSGFYRDQINNLPNYDYYFNPTPNALKESYIASFNQAQQILFSGLYAGEGNDIIKKIEYSSDPTNGCRLLFCGSTKSPCELPAVNSGVQNLYFQGELLGQEDGFIGRMDLDLFCAPLTSISKESSFDFRILPNPNVISTLSIQGLSMR